MLSFRQALILGILQGVSELFPISSLGHSIILPALLGWTFDQDANHFLTFLVATHFATAAVLFMLYQNDWARIIRSTVRSIWRGKLAEEPDAKMAGCEDGMAPRRRAASLDHRQLQDQRTLRERHHT